MYSVVLFGYIVGLHVKYFKWRIFSLYVDLKLIYFVFGNFDWSFVLAIVMRMRMGDRMVYPPPGTRILYTGLFHPGDML